MFRNKSIILDDFRHAFLILPFLTGCVQDDPQEEFRDFSPKVDYSLEKALSPLTDEDIIFAYHEGNPTMEATVELIRFSHDLEEGHTIELSVRVMQPTGRTWTEDLIWTKGEDKRSPHLKIPMVGLGQYEIAIEQFAVDGVVIAEGPLARHGLELLRDETGEASAVNCGLSTVIYGSNRGESLIGGPYTEDIRGYEGNDYLEGRACNDTFRGGGGIDTCHGGAGADTFYNCEYAYQ